MNGLGLVASVKVLEKNLNGFEFKTIEISSVCIHPSRGVRRTMREDMLASVLSLPLVTNPSGFTTLMVIRCAKVGKPFVIDIVSIVC